MDDLTLMFIAGVIILTMSLFLHLRKRQRIEAQRKAQRRKTALDAREKAIQQQKKMGEPVKLNPIPTNSDRIPLSDPVGKTFTGSISPQSIAKWEVEMHQIGRQIIGQIDSKMVALQTLNLEANRSANRLELLIEHLERLVKESQEIQKPSQSDENDNLVQKNSPKTRIESMESGQEYREYIKNTENTENIEEGFEIIEDEMPDEAEEVQTISISSVQRQAVQEPHQPEPKQPRRSNMLQSDEMDGNLERFADVLDSLESEIEDFQDDIEQLRSLSKQAVPAAKILKASDLPPQPQTVSQQGFSKQETQKPKKPIQTELNGEKERDAAFEVPKQDHSANSKEIPVPVSAEIRNSVREELGNPFALSSPRLPGGADRADGKMVSKKDTPIKDPSLPSNIKLKSHLEFQPSPSLPVPNPYRTSVSAKPIAPEGAAKRITVAAGQSANSLGKSKRPANGLSVDSLYQNDLKSDSVELSVPDEGAAAQLSSVGSHLTLRKQVETLAQSGYTANQIAQHLNITVGEVDLMLSLKH